MRRWNPQNPVILNPWDDQHDDIHDVNDVKVETTCFLSFLPIPGEMIQFDEHNFSNGLVQPPTSS